MTSSFETDHYDMIHDAQLDYYGRILATASSDRMIKLFDVSSADTQSHVADLSGHTGPVWRVAWAHPKFGSVLASCSYDQSVIIWKSDPSTGVWNIAHSLSLGASVNCVSFGSHELGLILAAACADGSIHVISLVDGEWTTTSLSSAHSHGVSSLSWAPEGARFTSCGSDSRVCVWERDSSLEWQMEAQLTQPSLAGCAHADRVRDVAWAPSPGVGLNTIVSCSEDHTVVIWTEAPGTGGQWKAHQKLSFDMTIWRVSWSTVGSILAITHGDNQVTLWKQSVDGQWVVLPALDADSVTN